jgi:hypothetical protein
MVEGCREGNGRSSSETEVPACRNTRARRGTRSPHCEIFTDSTEEGDGGANGWREQVGPVQEQGLFGKRESGLGVAGSLRTGTESFGVCWTCVG